MHGLSARLEVAGPATSQAPGPDTPGAPPRHAGEPSTHTTATQTPQNFRGPHDSQDVPQTSVQHVLRGYALPRCHCPRAGGWGCVVGAPVQSSWSAAKRTASGDGRHARGKRSVDLADVSRFWRERLLNDRDTVTRTERAKASGPPQIVETKCGPSERGTDPGPGNPQGQEPRVQTAVKQPGRSGPGWPGRCGRAARL